MGISRSEIYERTEKYDIEKPSDLYIVITCSHSALFSAQAAQDWGFKTIGITTPGRDKTYTKYYPHLFDKFIYVPYFEKKEGDKKIHMPLDNILKETEGLPCVILPNRSFFTYAGRDAIENELIRPIFGGRRVLGAEERTAENNQYDILRRAGIRTPKQYKHHSEIDRLVMVKVQQKDDSNERAFFCPSSPEEYESDAKQRIETGLISQEDLDKAIIEEFIVGPNTNANFHAYGLHNVLPGMFPTEIDLLGFGTRRQANRSGLMEMPALEQSKLLKENGQYKIKIINEETSHSDVTMRESLLNDFFTSAENFVEAVNHFYPDEMIGMFGEQGAMIIDQETNKDVFSVFDTAMRPPGDNKIGDTYVRLLNGKYKDIRDGIVIKHPFDLTMLELRTAIKHKVLSKIVT